MIKAIGEKIIIEPIIEETTKSGLILASPDESDTCLKGKVIAVGSEVVDKIVQPGKTILVERRATWLMELDTGEKYVWCDYKHALAIIEE